MVDPHMFMFLEESFHWAEKEVMFHSAKLSKFSSPTRQEGDENHGVVCLGKSLSCNCKKQMTSRSLLSVGNLIKLLPTGTFFVFQFLNPALTNNGECNGNNKSLCAILIGLCGISCFFSSFTDSYTGNDGNRHYGLVTPYGIFPSPASDSIDLSSYKLKFGDLVHAVLSVAVFAVLSLLDTNTVNCFYPGFQSAQQRLYQLLPIAIGLVAGGFFMIFPNNRHGYGYPLTSDSNDTAPPNNP